MGRYTRFLENPCPFQTCSLPLTDHGVDHCLDHCIDDDMGELLNVNNNGSVNAKSPYTTSILAEVKSKNDHWSKTKRSANVLEKLQFQHERFIYSVKKHCIADTSENYISGKFTLGAWPNRYIGVFTSGSSAQGMNAALRSVVRTGQYLGSRVFYIKEGYQGLVNGQENIVETSWLATDGIGDKAGSVIGCQSCPEFRKRSGRLKAARNLVMRRITDLVCIGSFGSLVGLNLLRQEWPSLMSELMDKDPSMSCLCTNRLNMNVVGVAAATDNDLCGPDFTIGASSALRQIMTLIDDLTSTLVSQKRVFVLEVMGKKYGCLPLIAGIACEASIIYIPEDPPTEEWRDQLFFVMNAKLSTEKNRYNHIILVSEGAVDTKGKPITADNVKQAVTTQLEIETTVITVWPELQRAGGVSQLDRCMGCRHGAEAVLTLMQGTPDTPAYVICGVDMNVVRVPLQLAIEKTTRAARELAEGNAANVVNIRGREFYVNLYVHQLQCASLFTSFAQSKCQTRLGIVVVGHPSCGINSAARGFVNVCLVHGFAPVFLYDGWEGLLKDKVKEVTWDDVQMWSADGGSHIGCSLLTATEVGRDKIARQLGKHKICGLVIIGGFQAFQSACEILEKRYYMRELCIPITVLPVSFANNVPGCPRSLGSSSALNQICQVIGDIRLTSSTQKVINLVEVGGHNCGFLATVGGIINSADRVFIREVPFTITSIQQTCEYVRTKFATTDLKDSLIFMNKHADPNLTTDVVHRILSEESRGDFICRKVELKGTMFSQTANYHDRQMGAVAGVKAALWLISRTEEIKEGKVRPDWIGNITLTAINSNFFDTPVHISDLRHQADFENKVPKNQWWMELRPLINVLSSAYLTKQIIIGCRGQVSKRTG